MKWKETGLIEEALADMRYTFIEKVVEASVVKCHESKEHKRSVMIDKILTGKYTAIPMFFAVMFVVFWLTFDVIGQRLSDLLSSGIDYLTVAVGKWLTNYGINPVVRSLIIDGIFTGVGSVLSFLPIIVVLVFLSFLIIERYRLYGLVLLLSWTNRLEKSVCPAVALFLC